VRKAIADSYEWYLSAKSLSSLVAVDDFNTLPHASNIKVFLLEPRLMRFVRFLWKSAFRTYATHSSHGTKKTVVYAPLKQTMLLG
jgi:hypothetical protein